MRCYAESESRSWSQVVMIMFIVFFGLALFCWCYVKVNSGVSQNALVVSKLEQ